MTPLVGEVNRGTKINYILIVFWLVNEKSIYIYIYNLGSNHSTPEGIKIHQIAKYVVNIEEVWLSIPSVVSRTRSAVHSPLRTCKISSYTAASTYSSKSSYSFSS
jgi:hypothetical protein